MNCPLCGADIIMLPDTKKVYCPDKECVAHQYGLLIKTDQEGITYLAEAFFEEMKDEDSSDFGHS